MALNKYKLSSLKDKHNALTNEDISKETKKLEDATKKAKVAKKPKTS
jgi:hypothetical protein